MWRRYEKVRPFKPGAFRFAVKFNVPVLPLFIEFRQTKPRKVLRLKEKVVMHILPAVYPEEEGTLRAKSDALLQKVRAAMIEKYESLYRKPMVFDCGEKVHGGSSAWGERDVSGAAGADSDAETKGEAAVTV